MDVGLHDADQTRFPNLALMKLSAWHKAKGHSVEFYNPNNSYKYIYSSQVFTYTKEQIIPGAICGGTGYLNQMVLSDGVEHICPDYDLYKSNFSQGFLTRGCPNKCPHCFVPHKEGKIRAAADVEEFLKHRDVVLMDNNVLAHPHGIEQIEKLARLNLKVDFNQGLDARLIDHQIAKRLAKIKWRVPLRLACDHSSQIPVIQKAVSLLRYNNCTPRDYFVYVLVQDDVNDALERVKFLKGLMLDPFAQIYRDVGKFNPTPDQKRFTRWVNHKAIFKKITWEEYSDTFYKKRNNYKRPNMRKENDHAKSQ